ncbi:MAG: hypothetical protein KBT22_04405 [Bacteroidales bacterium]|nr:hypothetical protein [Candidatus Scybalocola fimicaballi]
MKSENEEILDKKRELTQYLYYQGRLWSYKIKTDTILSDRELIEKSLNYLAFEDMWMLWEIYSEDYIRKVWEEDMLPNETFFGITNRQVAPMLFGIENYDAYREKICGKKE